MAQVHHALLGATSAAAHPNTLVGNIRRGASSVAGQAARAPLHPQQMKHMAQNTARHPIQAGRGAVDTTLGTLANAGQPQQGNPRLNLFGSTDGVQQPPNQAPY